MIEAARLLIGWDPGRPNGLHHLLTHPTLPRNDTTTTENISVLIPPLNPFTSMRAPQDEVNDALDCPSITCGWDPGRPNEPPLLLMHPTNSTLLRNDETTTENISAPIPLLNPFASMRAPQDEDNAALDRPCVCLLLQDLLQSCARAGGGEWRTCAMRYDEPRLVWTRLTTTH
jgi:hypothetical protein